jgi:cobalt-precorrin 5A hydrolase
MIAVGIGANSRAHKDDFAAAIIEARGEAGGGDVVATFGDAVFAIHVRAAAQAQSMVYRSLALEALRERSEDCLTRSERTLALFGIASVAEASALVAAGRGSHLILPRRIIGNITVAVARSPRAKDDPQ